MHPRWFSSMLGLAVLMAFVIPPSDRSLDGGHSHAVGTADLGEPGATMPGCYRCADDVLNKEHAIIEDTTAAIQWTADATHGFEDGACNVEAHGHQSGCNQQTEDADALLALANGKSIETASVARFIAEDIAGLVVNPARRAVQILACDGQRIIAHVPVSVDVLAAMEIALAHGSGDGLRSGT